MPCPFSKPKRFTFTTFHFYSASALLAMLSAILAMIDSVRLFVRHSPVSCQNASSYNHAVFATDSRMSLVSCG